MASEKQIAANKKNAKKAGRKKGSVNKDTKIVQAMQKTFREKVSKMATKLMKAQAVQALGYHKMLAVTRDADGKMSVETVRDKKRFDDFLENGVLGKDYMLVVAKEPDYKASDALMNRAWGRPKETVEVQGEEGGPLLINFGK